MCVSDEETFSYEERSIEAYLHEWESLSSSQTRRMSSGWPQCTYSWANYSAAFATAGNATWDETAEVTLSSTLCRGRFHCSVDRQGCGLDESKNNESRDKDGLEVHHEAWKPEQAVLIFLNGINKWRLIVIQSSDLRWKKIVTFRRKWAKNLKPFNNKMQIRSLEWNLY